MDRTIKRRPMKIRDSRFFTWSAAMLSRAGVTPNAISIAGLIVGMVGAVLLAGTVWAESDAGQRWMWLAAAVVVPLRGVFNILDGVTAVNENIASPVGELYNEVPDRVADVAMLVGAGYAVGGDPVLGMAAAIAAVFVAYIRAQINVVGAPQDYRGPMSKPGRLFLIAITALYLAVSPASWQPDWGPNNSWGLMSATLLVVIGGCIYTAVRRLLRACRVLKESPE